MLVDAYMHVGEPRYGTAADVLATMDAHKIDKAVLVHGPFAPDLKAICEAHNLAADRLRCIGVPLAPWQGDETQAQELVDVMLDMGVIGFRIQNDEYLRCDYLFEQAGKQGRWIYAVNPHSDQAYTDYMLTWLDTYPQGRIMLPHHMHLDTDIFELPGMHQLLSHERVFAIMSRYGGASKEEWPHNDLSPWVKKCVDIMGLDKLCWGSEYPVLYWRNEQIPETKKWLGEHIENLDITIYQSQLADRLLFQETAFEAKDCTAPDWLHYESNPVPLMGYQFSPEQYAELLQQYIHTNNQSAVGFHDFIKQIIDKGLKHNA
ncbi:MAG: hypothetical protein HRU15_00050 [Planctomycetes bacterium]|nr:hypothetical protein [Planctomycetota bacterium]